MYRRKCMYIAVYRPCSWHSYSSHSRSLSTPAGSSKAEASQREQVSRLVSDLKSCSTSRDQTKGRMLHEQAVNSGYHLNVYVATTLVDMYTKCGNLIDARRVFDTMPIRSAVSWNAMILGYVANGQSASALELFESMSCPPTSRTFVAALMACSSLAALEEGSQADGSFVKRRSLARGVAIHKLASECGFCGDMFLESTLVDMYSKCGDMSRARTVFDKLVFPNTVAWNALILGYAINGESQRALQVFEEMVSTGCVPNSRTYVPVFMACAELASLEEATLLEGRLVRVGTLERGMSAHSQALENRSCANIFVENTLVDMYSKCGSMVDARIVFDRMASHSVVSWNNLLLGYVGSGDSSLALELFACMVSEERVVADERTYVAALMACSSLAVSEEAIQIDGRLVKTGSLSKGMCIHSVAARSGYGDGMFLRGSLLDMYSKCGSMTDARGVLESNPEQDVVLWTALITGYADNGESELALELFAKMNFSSCRPNFKTYAAALTACGNSMSLETGKSLHAEICRQGLENKSGASLVSFYGKCGRMSIAEHVFDCVALRDVVAWNSMLAGYSQHGDQTRVLKLFEEIQERGLRTNGITFVPVLAACSHAGMVDKGVETFNGMRRCGVAPGVQHYNCMVDMLARAGRMEQALQLLKSMPVKLNAVTWTSVLGACCKWKNVEVGRLAFVALLELDEEDSTAYLLMANVYGSLGMWKERGDLLGKIQKRKERFPTSML